MTTISTAAASTAAASTAAASTAAASKPASPRPGTGPARLGVPWSTVVTLAVVMAYADGFWMTSLRGAFGAIGRTQQPFASWWRESTLALPLFALAVLGALTLALRRFGPAPATRRAVLATALLVAAAGTLVGVSAIAASSAYDYHLQATQLRFMNSMHSICTGSCLAQQVHATLALQIHAVLFAARTLLITNLVLVAWVVALRGGRLRLSTPRRRRHALNQPGRTARSRVEDIRLLLVAGLLASAAIRAAAVPAHLATSTSAGLSLLLLSGAGIAVAAVLLARPQHRRALQAAALIALAPLLLWLATHTIGLPIGPTAGVHRDSITLSGCIAVALQAGTLLAAVALLRGAARLRQRPPISAHLTGLTLLAITTATLLALTPTGPPWLADTPTPTPQHTMTMPH